MASSGHERDAPHLKVGGVDGAFFAADEDADHAPEGGRASEAGEEVQDEAVAGVDGEGGGVMESFGGF